MEFILDFDPILIFLLIIFIFICFVTFHLLKKNKKVYSFYEYLVIFTFLLYLGGIVKFAIFPIHLFFGEAKPDNLYSLKHYIELVPIKSTIVFLQKGLFIQVIGNVLLFLPFGVFLGFFKRDFKLKDIIRYIFLISFTLEAVQLVISLLTAYPNRYFDTSDLILNTLGGLIGWLILKILMPYLPSNLTKVFNIT